jgi:hypothetical protein
MVRNLADILLVLALGGVIGCAGMGKTTMTAADIASQAQGVAAALEALPAIPGDAKTKEQIQGYAAWGAFLAKTAAAVAGS